MSEYIVLGIEHNGDAPPDYDTVLCGEDYESANHEYIKKCTNAEKRRNTEVHLCMILDSFKK